MQLLSKEHDAGASQLDPTLSSSVNKAARTLKATMMNPVIDSEGEILVK